MAEKTGISHLLPKIPVISAWMAAWITINVPLLL